MKKYKYDKKGIILSLADLIIASQVKETNMTLVTKDKIFERIEEINKVLLD
ncbi:PIN domain-containing protein [Candidatus Woesearchaeota archaeon]|nr:PIN domain-containing protein [Candidatus Woesearchaeota archaeon]